MSTRTRRTSLLTALVLTLAASAALAQDADQDKDFHWKGKLSAENVVFIKNVSGAIDAEASSGDEVEVTAEKSGSHADEVSIKMVHLSDGVMFCAVYQGWYDDHCDGSHHNLGHSDNLKVHFTIKLPENLRFIAENVNGEVVAENLGRFVKATSVNGKVRVSTKAWAELTSVNGSLEARMGRSDWPGTLKLETVNGSISVELPNETNADVEFDSVNGHLRTEFPLTTQGSIDRHSIKGTIGAGGRELRVETVNGSVEIKRASL